MSKKSSKGARNGWKRHNISMDEPTRARAEKLAETEKRSVSNMLAVLVDREWERLLQQAKEAKAA